MTVNVGKELAALRRMSVDDLRARYADVFGETTNGRHKDWLIKRIIYRLQVLAEGDLSERARRPPKPAAEAGHDEIRNAVANKDRQTSDQWRLAGSDFRQHDYSRLQGRNA